MFKTGFKKFVCVGDTIAVALDGIDYVATVYRDDTNESPDQRDDGFWPSLNPASAGYIGPKSARTLARHMAKATEVLRAWRDGEWFYCGVSVTASKGGAALTDEFESALWGVDCNYPGSDNSYLLEVANELLPDCQTAAKKGLVKLLESLGITQTNFDVADHFVPALINGDYSEMTTEDAIQLNAFRERECEGRGHWAQPESPEAGYGTDEVTGLKASLQTVTWVRMGE